MNKTLLSLFSVLALGVVSTQGAEPWMATVTKDKPGSNLKIKPVNLAYQLSWKGTVNSGTLNFVFGKSDPKYPQAFICQAYGKSTGLAASLYPYEFNYVSFLRKSDYTPLTFVGNESGKKDRKVTTNKYSSKTVISKEVKTYLQSRRAAKTTKNTFAFANTLDLMSAMLYIRSLDLRTGSTKTIVVHPFKTPYLITAKSLGKVTHLGQPAIKLDVQIQKIEGNMKLATYDKMKKATLWLSDDSERIPLELRVNAFIGDVRATLAAKKFL